MQESVDCVKFSHNGQYLAAADVDGAIKVYDGNDFKSFHTVIELGDDFKVISIIRNLYTIWEWVNCHL